MYPFGRSMVLLKHASSLGHPQARVCLGLGKRVLLHSLVDGDAEFLDGSPDRASLHTASNLNNSSSSSHLRLAVSPLQPPSRPNLHHNANSSTSSSGNSGAVGVPGSSRSSEHPARRRRSGGTELNGRVGVATAFEETTGRLVVQLVQPSGEETRLPGSKLAVRAANVRMER